MVWTGDHLNTKVALNYLNNLRNGSQKFEKFPDGCVIPANLTQVADVLYHRTCNFLDWKAMRPDKKHCFYQFVVEIRTNNRASLEYILVHATTKYTTEKHKCLMELLSKSLKTENTALQLLDIIENDEIIDGIFAEKEGDYK